MAELDLDAILAAEDEAFGGPHKVTWHGQVFAVPRTDNWPIQTFDVLAQGQLTSGLAMILGDNWGAFCEAGEPTVGAAKTLLDGIAQAEGFESMGESLASSPLSNRATRRSKPTSSRTTK